MALRKTWSGFHSNGVGVWGVWRHSAPLPDESRPWFPSVVVAAVWRLQKVRLWFWLLWMSVALLFLMPLKADYWQQTWVISCVKYNACLCIIFVLLGVIKCYLENDVVWHLNGGFDVFRRIKDHASISLAFHLWWVWIMNIVRSAINI